MRALYQIICYFFTLLILQFCGNLFDVAFQQAGDQAKHLGGMPLPVITTFLIAHHRLSGYLLLFPWLAFVGAPLLSSSATRDYWEASGFFLRFAAFLTVETFVFLAFLYAIARTFVLYHGHSGMEDSHESAVRLTYWGMFCLVVAAAVFRLIQRRKS